MQLRNFTVAQFLLIAATAANAGIVKHTIVLKPSFSGEAIVVQPSLVDEPSLDASSNKSIIKLLGDTTFVPQNQSNISVTPSDDSIKFSYSFSYQFKASQRFKNCVANWFESLDAISSRSFLSFLYPADPQSDTTGDWKSYAAEQAALFTTFTEEGKKECPSKEKWGELTYGVLLKFDRYFEKSSSLTADDLSRLDAFSASVFTKMKADVSQKLSNDLLQYIKSWSESLRSKGVDQANDLDITALWSRQKLSRPDIAGRVLLKLASKDRIISASETKDPSGIYGALYSVDSLLNACTIQDYTVSACADPEALFWLEIKTSSGTSKFLLFQRN